MGGERDREVICREHGARYDPLHAAGCKRCLGEDRPAAAPAGSAGWGMRIAAALGVLVIGTFFLRESEESAPVAEAEGEHPLMEAHPYRPMIERIESALYAERGRGRADAEHVRRWAEQLAKRMKEWESRLYMTPHIGKVREFGGWVGARSASGFGEADRLATRERWEALRRDVFEPADWFRQPD